MPTTCDPASWNGCSTPCPSAASRAPRPGRTRRSSTGSGVHNWAELTVDEARGIVYIPTGTARYDFYGGNRHGREPLRQQRAGARREDRQAASGTSRPSITICGTTTCATAPKLLTVRHDGRDVDVVAQASKHGFLFVFERDHGPPAVADRRAAGAADRRAGRADVADAAVPDAAAAVRAADVHRARHQSASLAGGTGEAPRPDARRT